MSRFGEFYARPVQSSSNLLRIHMHNCLRQHGELNCGFFWFVLQFVLLLCRL